MPDRDAAARHLPPARGQHVRETRAQVVGILGTVDDDRNERDRLQRLLLRGSARGGERTLTQRVVVAWTGAVWDEILPPVSRDWKPD